jgi:hypothetical protein
MRNKLWVSFAFGLVVTTQAFAAGDETDDPNYLNRVESPVFEVVGDHQAITKHAATCIAQIIKPGLVSAPTIVSQDNDAGVIVANNSLKYSHGLLQPTVRTTLTFQAKDGRFKILHTNIEQFLDQYGWNRVGMRWMQGGDAAKKSD